jgi:hypothetical protein
MNHIRDLEAAKVSQDQGHSYVCCEMQLCVTLTESYATTSVCRESHGSLKDIVARKQMHGLITSIHALQQLLNAIHYFLFHTIYARPLLLPLFSYQTYPNILRLPTIPSSLTLTLPLPNTKRQSRDERLLTRPSQVSMHGFR